MKRPAGILKKFATTSNGISGVVAFAFAGPATGWAASGEALSRRATARLAVRDIIDSTSVQAVNLYRVRRVGKQSADLGRSATRRPTERGVLSIHRLRRLRG